jgi:protein involved in polysaccharide export with SLBB domain
MAQGALAFVLTGCCASAAGAGQGPAASQAGGDRNAVAVSAQRSEYVLRAGDVVEIRFFYNPELNDTIQIRPDGRIALPLVGDVALSGDTVAGVTRRLEALYLPHLRSPSVTVQVRSYGSQKVYVGGEVPRPGTVQLVGNLTVVDAIMEAGGLKLTGDPSRIVLIRKQGDGTAVARGLALMDSARQPTPDSLTPLLPYDVILIPQTKIARLDRWVDQYVRQLVPLDLTLGFSYLMNTSAVIATK